MRCSYFYSFVILAWVLIKKSNDQPSQKTSCFKPHDRIEAIKVIKHSVDESFRPSIQKKIHKFSAIDGINTSGKAYRQAPM